MLPAQRKAKSDRRMQSPRIRISKQWITKHNVRLCHTPEPINTLDSLLYGKIDRLSRGIGAYKGVSQHCRIPRGFPKIPGFPVFSSLSEASLQCPVQGHLSKVPDTTRFFRCWQNTWHNYGIPCIAKIVPIKILDITMGSFAAKAVALKSPLQGDSC